MNARKCALDLLACREHSRAELFGKLKVRGVATDAAQDVLDALGQEDLLSDRRFANEYAASRASKGFGLHHIHAQLSARGVMELLTQQALDELAERLDLWVRGGSRQTVR